MYVQQITLAQPVPLTLYRGDDPALTPTILSGWYPAEGGAASLVPRLVERGVRRFRVEFVRESQADAARVLAAYTDLLAARCTPADAIRRAAVHEQFGVTRGTMRVLG